MHKAQLYTAANAIQRQDAAAVLAQYRDRMSWPENCDVLDVGCGSGDVTHKLLLPSLRSFRRLVGIDVSPSMITFATNNHNHPRLFFSSLDIENSDKPRSFFPNGFHKIFSFYCLHWITKQRQALQNIFDLLEPNGELLLVFLAKNPIFTVYERLAASSLWSPYMQDAARFISPYQYSERPSLELRELLVATGFNVEDCECRDQTCSFSSRQLFRNAVTAVNPFIERIPKELQDEFLDHCTNETEELGTRSTDGTLSINYKLFVAFAKKPLP